MKKTLLFCYLIISSLLFANSNPFESGKLYLAYNMPGKAISHFQEAIEYNPNNIEAYLYLALCYEIENQYNNAVDVLKRASFRDSSSPLVYFNLGNNYFLLNEFKEANYFYSKAIELNSNYPQAYLNRANSFFKLDDISQAIYDYKKYLRIAPEAKQKDKIEELIALLEQRLVEIEREKELESLRQREEALRQQRLLEELLGSIQDASSSVSVDDNTPKGYDFEFDIDE